MAIGGYRGTVHRVQWFNVIEIIEYSDELYEPRVHLKGLKMKCLCQKALLDQAIREICRKKPEFHNRLVLFTARLFNLSSFSIEKRVTRELERRCSIDAQKKIDFPFNREWLKHSRVDILKINQMDASELLGVSWATYQAYESGRFKMPFERWKKWLDIVERGGKENGEIKSD